MNTSSFLRSSRFAVFFLAVMGNVVLAQNPADSGPNPKGPPENRSQPSAFYLADGTERLRFAEPETTQHARFKEPLLIDLTNPATNSKRGMSIYSYTTNRSSTINTGGIRLITYTPPDNGGDVSGLFSLQTGGGNAITAYNKSSQVPNDPTTSRPFPTYPNNGFAIEATADGNKHSIESTAYNGFAFWDKPWAHPEALPFITPRRGITTLMARGVPFGSRTSRIRMTAQRCRPGRYSSSS